ncbi:hypothetical protein B0H17DRAFT_1149181 [Mycena rosella]|uniref:Uncharacterized protein n=1 Tax=Mycena rosella TaxID=1033263 RepID=A0AAD7C662_MYCRO|nr:hypothetical protein B0H17DRAFT_1149181 [Mycena rosella]
MTLTAKQKRARAAAQAAAKAPITAGGDPPPATTSSSIPAIVGNSHDRHDGGDPPSTGINVLPSLPSSFMNQERSSKSRSEPIAGSRMQSNSSAERASVDARLSTSLVDRGRRTTKRVKSTQPTLTEVTDEDDCRPETRRERGVPRHSRTNLQITGESSPERETVKSSPYPEAMTSGQRAERRAGKQRRNCADEYESEEMREAVARSRADMGAQLDDESDSDPGQHDPNMVVARAILASGRRDGESTEEFRSRHAAYLQSLNIQCTRRIDEDRLFAEAVVVQEQIEVADQNLAEELAHAEQLEADKHTLAELLASKQRDERRQLRKQAESAQRALQCDEEATARAEKTARTRNIYMTRETERSRNKIASLQEQSRHTSIASSRTRISLPKSSGSATTKSVPESGSGDRTMSGPMAGECTPTSSARPVHSLKDRVVLQKYHSEEIAATGTSRIEDQGITWDIHGKAIEVGPAPSRGSSVGTTEVKELRAAAPWIRAYLIWGSM